MFNINFSHPVIRALSILILIIGCFTLFRSCHSHSSLPLRENYRIARDIDWRSVNLMNKKNNMQGFTNDLFLLFSKEQKISFEFIDTRGKDLLDGLDRGNYEAILTGVAPDSFLKEQYYFSDPFFSLGPVLIVRTNSPISSLEDMSGKIIAVLSNDSTISTILSSHDVMFASYSSVTDALDDLQNNKIDGVILSTLPAHIYTESLYANRLKIVTPPLNNFGLRIVTLHNAQEKSLVELFNKSLQEAFESGSYDMLIQKWGLINPYLLQDAKTVEHPTNL